MKIASICVIGDAIVDEYADCRVTRVAPEAPVAIHAVHRTWSRPGGAANVAIELAALGAETRFVGLAGRDAAGHALADLLEEARIDTSGVITDPALATVRKLRAVASGNVLLRLDYEPASLPSAELSGSIIKEVTERPSSCVVVSDYCKGTLLSACLKELLAVLREKSVPVIVDTKNRDYSILFDAFILKPNYDEAITALQLPETIRLEPEEVIERLRAKFSLRNILLTCSENGMYLSLEGESDCRVYPALNSQPRDVTGAGDAVAAAFAFGISRSMSLPAAVDFANQHVAMVISSPREGLGGRVSPGSEGLGASADGPDVRGYDSRESGRL